MRSFLVPLFCATAIAAQRRMTGGYIVELASTPSGKRFADPHAEFLEALDRRAVGNFHTRQEYRSELFTGIAVQLTTPEELVNLASLPNVVAVHTLYIQAGPEPVKKRVVSSPDEAPVLGRSVHIMTGVDLVHASGIKGKDVQIAIIDSGVDYMHPALGGGFGPGFKIAGGTDLVGDAYDGENTAVPDNDPMDCRGHGTHVTGIIGANPDNEFHVVGVAPEAKIFMYKVGGCKGGIGDDVIVAAIARAVEEGADVISMSFGSPDGWSDSALAIVASRATERGVVVTVSAGNDGDAGLLYSSAPAIGENVISVGSVENTAVITQTFVTNVENGPIKYTSLASPYLPGNPVPGVPTTPLPVLAIMPFPDGTDAGDCSDPRDMPADIPDDLSGLAVVLYGSDNLGCPVFEFTMMRNPAVILNYKNPYLLIGGSNPSVLISDEDGFWLAEQSKKGNLTITFPGPLLEDSTGEAGGLMNDFSSMGPGNRLEFYPSVSAPGGDIMSTIPREDGLWGAESGTSMSNPYTAGSAALLLQAKGKGAAASVRALLQSTAQGLPASRAKDALPQTLAYQGAGLINVYAALNAKTELSPAQLELNATTHWKDTHNLTLSNHGIKSQTYTLAHVAAGTTVTKPENTPDLYRGAAPLVSAPAEVAFSKETVTIAAGESASIIVTISPPKSANTRTLPIVSGWITATSADGEVVKASYVGMAAPYDSAQVIATTNFYSPKSVMPNIFGESSWQNGPTDYIIGDVEPSLWFPLCLPSARVLIDLVDASTDIKSNVPHDVGVTKRDFSDWLPAVRGGGGHRVSAAAAASYPTLGPIGQFNYMVRNALPVSVELPRIRLDKFANGTRIPVGQYKALIRALRPFGDPEKDEDYDAFVSVQFGWVEA